jgi:predicted nucleic acid-binding protein
MIVFFDTSVHVEVLQGQLSVDAVLARSGDGPVRLSPVVASELLRGARGKALRAVEKLTTSLLPIEPPSWRQAFLDAGRLLPVVFRDHEEVGLGRLQNDALLALTARHTGAVLATKDKHFVTLAKKLKFRYALIR